MSNLLSNLNQH